MSKDAAFVGVGMTFLLGALSIKPLTTLLFSAVGIRGKASARFWVPGSVVWHQAPTAFERVLATVVAYAVTLGVANVVMVVINTYFFEPLFGGLEGLTVEG